MMKFDSFYGFAINNAKDGEKVGIALQANCNDPRFQQGIPVMAMTILDELVYPEVMHRIETKQLTPSFRLWRAHIVMHIDSLRNEILLNEEVRMKALVNFVDGRKFEPGQIVKKDDIAEIFSLYASEKNDPNAAHIMLVKFQNRWHFAFDLIYNRQKVGNRFDLSKQFLKSAENNMGDRSWGPMVDNLFSATELAAQSIFLLHPHPGFSNHQNHDETRKLFTAYAENGNIDIKYSKHFTKLDELRPKGRYLNSVASKGFTLEESEAEELVNLTHEMVMQVGKWLQSIDWTRKPKSGHYIAFGQG
jgi:hypothetical protein